MSDAAPAAGAVEIHAIHVVVWDVPATVTVGDRFSMKVGIKCADACALADRTFAVYDHHGAQVAVGALSRDPWPGTTGLYAAEVELAAPADEGLHDWTVRAADADLGAPHVGGSTSFGLRVVSRPEHLVTIEAVDRERQTPLAGVRVVMHPYRAVTDERGMAVLRVAKGSYRLFVSETRYLTFGQLLDVEADVTTRAELDVEPIVERN